MHSWNALHRDEPASMSDEVVAHVRRAVREGEMAPGTWYSAYRLAEQLSVSRSPVREGLLRLEEVGLITFSRNRGFQVVPTTGADVAEIFAMRLALEVPAVRRAARLMEGDVTRLDQVSQAMHDAAGAGAERDFFALDRTLHGMILTAGGGRRVLETVDRLRAVTKLLGVSTAADQRRTLHDIAAEHDPVIEALRRQDADAAASSMREHLCVTGYLLIAQALGVDATDPSVTETWERFAAEHAAMR